jgi:hypothetical protein
MAGVVIGRGSRDADRLTCRPQRTAVLRRLLRREALGDEALADTQAFGVLYLGDQIARVVDLAGEGVEADLVHGVVHRW